MNPYCMQSPVSHSVLISVLCVCVYVCTCVRVSLKDRERKCALFYFNVFHRIWMHYV